MYRESVSIPSPSIIENVEFITEFIRTSEEFVESFEELRARLDAMKKLMGDDLERKRQKRKKLTGESIIDGSFLSVVFGVVLLMIIGVSFYAFMNLYYAILKKFPAQQHTEL